MPPFVSVLMVAWNAGRFLDPAVHSILAQTHANLELILVDNASTDGSVAALQSHCRDSRLKIFPQAKNLFHSGGLIAGLPHCAGEFVAIMDADDLSDPARLERQVTTLLADDTLAAVACAARTIDEEGKVTGLEFPWRTRAEIRAFSRYDMPVIFPTLMCRRGLLESVPIRGEFTRVMDFDFIGRAVEQFDIVCLDETLFSYRRHAASVTQSKPLPMFVQSCVIRLAKARRMARTPENLAELLTERERALQDGTMGKIMARFAEKSLSENLFEQAVFHARRAARGGESKRGLRVLIKALARGRSALPRGEYRFLWRLALSGTVAALPLRIELDNASEA